MKTPIRSLLVVAILLYPCTLFSETFFSEDFESGTNPFSFDGYNDYQTSNGGAAAWFSGELLDVGGTRGNVWKTTFHHNCNDSYFGHSIQQKSTWNITNKFHWRCYVKFGDTDDAPEWQTSTPRDGCSGIQTQRSYELKFPDIGGGNNLAQGRIIGKMRSSGSNTTGRFRLYTPNGQNHNHDAQGTAVFVSNTWYCVEFMVEDNGSNDVVKIWINNNDEDSPDYSHTGGDMFNSTQWTSVIRWNHGYRNHDVPADRNFYYDNMAFGNSFIGLADQATGVTSGPVSLQSTGRGISVLTDKKGVSFNVNGLENEGFVLTVKDIAGKTVWTHQGNNRSSLSPVVRWNRPSEKKSITPGLFFVTLNSNNEQRNSSFILLH